MVPPLLKYRTLPLAVLLLSGLGPFRLLRAQETASQAKEQAPPVMSHPMMMQHHPGMMQNAPAPGTMGGGQRMGMMPGQGRMQGMRRSPGMAARGRARMPRAGAGLGMMGGPGVGQGPAGRMPTMLRRPEVQQALGLTAEQKKKLEDIAFNSAKAAIQGRSTLQIEHMELTRLMSSANPDRAAIDKKLQDISQAQAALTRSVINGQLDARGVLTKEQQEKMPQVMQKLRAERVQQPGPGQEPGPKSQTEPRPQKSRTIPIPKAPSPPDKQ